MFLAERIVFSFQGPKHVPPYQERARTPEQKFSDVFIETKEDTGVFAVSESEEEDASMRPAFSQPSEPKTPPSPGPPSPDRFSERGRISIRASSSGGWRSHRSVPESEAAVSASKSDNDNNRSQNNRSTNNSLNSIQSRISNLIRRTGFSSNANANAKAAPTPDNVSKAPVQVSSSSSLMHKKAVELSFRKQKEHLNVSIFQSTARTNVPPKQVALCFSTEARIWRLCSFGISAKSIVNY